MENDKSIVRHVPRGSSNPEGDYRKSGDDLANRIQATLAPSEGCSFFDIGCGSGRVAGGMLRTIPSFRYVGFDIRLSDILNAKSAITSENSDIQFVHLDFYNERYNAKGRIKNLSHYSFPAPSKSFDHAIATSFFTHTNTEMTQRCLKELRRVLKPGGTAYLTFFVFGEDMVQSSESNRQYSTEFEPHVWAADPDHLLQAVAFEQSKLIEMLGAADLKSEKFIRGEWRGKNPEQFADALNLDNDTDIRSSQDILIVRAE
ncbi:MAG: class I SAM-dependent methyltransferase [Pseudomonadota bacterium]